MNKTWPNVIIAGAPKCGTSSLFFWLTAHPDVCGSRVKETFYFDDRVKPRFNKNANYLRHGLSRYSQFWSHHKGEKLIIEASAQYIYKKTALHQLTELPERPKIVFIFRAPQKQIYSLYKFNKYRLGQIDDFETFEEFLSKNMERLTLGKGLIAQAHYVNYVQRWVNEYGKKDVLIYQFEKLTRDKLSFMKKVAEDLGIDPRFYDHFEFFKRNETRSMRFHKLHRIGLKLQPYVPQWFQEKVFIPLYLSLNSTRSPRQTQNEAELVEQLKSEFKASNQKLKELFPSLDLTLWE